MAKKKTNNKLEMLNAVNDAAQANYELVLLMPPILPDDVQKRVMPKIEKIVKGLKGNITVSEDWGKRHLAYEIAGNEEGYYLFTSLDIEPSKVDRLQVELTRLADILRFLLVRRDLKKSKTNRGLSKEVKMSCPFNGNPDLVNFKDVYNLRKKFITTRGRILPASKTGVSHRCQRKLGVEIKRARYLALLPYTNYT